MLPQGWNGVIAPDKNCAYFIISNFKGDQKAEITGLEYDGWAPVFCQPTIITDNKATVTFTADHNTSIAQPIAFMIKGDKVLAEQIDTKTILLTATERSKVTVLMFGKDKEPYLKKQTLRKGKSVKLQMP